MLVLVSRCNPHLVDASCGAIHHARRRHMTTYEMIMGRFTAQRCLFGWNSMVASEKILFLALSGLAWEWDLRKNVLPVFAWYELTNSTGTVAAHPDRGDKQQRSGQGRASDGSPSTDRAGGIPWAWFLWGPGIPPSLVTRAGGLPAVRIASPRFPSLPGSRQAQLAALQPGLSRGAAIPRLAPAALLRALVMAGPACRRTGPLKYKPLLAASTW